jgi:hypothetical protein
MCNVAAVASMAGGVYGAIGAVQEGQAEKNLNDFNANQFSRAAKDALVRGEETVRRQREYASGVTGAQRAGYAGQGVSLDTGSAVEAQEDTARLSELDVATIRNNARREAYGYRVQAAAARYQGHLSKWAGKKAAIGSLLGGAGKAAGSFS